MVPITVSPLWLLLLTCLFQGTCCDLVSGSCLKHQTYTVSSSGSDTPGCTTGNSTAPCRHLEYLLLKVQTCANVTILSNLTLTGTVRPSPLTDVIIAGSTSSPITISCAKSSGQGLIFSSSQRLHLQGLRFVSCSVQCLHDNAGIYPFMDYAAVCIHQGSDVNITNCIFQNSTGTGVVMHDVIGSNQLVDTNFTMNGLSQEGNSTSGALIIKRQSVPGMANFSLQNCHFVENKNLNTFLYHSLNSTSLAGALHLHTGVQDSTTHLRMKHSHFSKNEASIGGGVHVNQSGNNSALIIEVSSSHFESNRAGYGGGGMWFFQTSHKCSCNLSFLNSSFVNNSGEWGGGVGVYSNSSAGNVTIEANNSTWSNNSASLAAAAVGIAGWAEPNAIPNNKTLFHVTGEFKNCSISRNYGRGNDIGKDSVGSVQIRAARARFHDCHFNSNTRTALYVYGFSYAAFSGSITFTANKGINGAAVYVDSKSLIGLEEGVTLLFEDNHALIKAGAIYTEPLDPSFHVPQDTCVFESLGMLLKSKGMYKVYFSNNTANGNNQTLFVGSSWDCVNTNNGSILLFDSKVFTFEPPGNGQILSVPSNLTHLGYFPSNDNYLEVMFGQFFFLVPNVTDVFGNSAYLTGSLILVEHADSETIKALNDLELVGPAIISMDGYTQQHELYIKGDEKYIGNEQLFIVFIYKLPRIYHNQHKEWRLKLVKCRTGFRYDHQLMMCKQIVDDNLLGSANLSHACIRYGYWLGDYAQTSGKTLPCSGELCQYEDGNCPPHSHKCPDFPGFCQLNATDHLCWEGRGGVLCSRCVQNYSFTFGGVQCAPSSTCSGPKAALIMLGVMLYWVFVIILMLVILSLDLSIGLGFLYGIVYYFSTLTIVTDVTITSSALLTIIYTCMAITQLTPRGFGDIHVCFIESMDLNMHHHFFNYITPMFVIAIIVVIILKTRYCRCPKVISLAENSPIHAICVLVLFSYTSLTYTSFKILKPIRINQTTKVYIDPEKEYFGPEHLPFAIVAVILECFISLPLCFFILFAPFLSRRVNMVKLKLKPFLDDFQACYRPGCHWFAGFYFLARQVVFFVNVIPLGWMAYENHIFHLVNLIVFLVHTMLQPYKVKWLNLLDTVLLFDILVVSMLRTTDIINIVLSYLLIFPPALYLVAIILLFSARRILVLMKLFRSRRGDSSTELPTAPPFRSVTTTTVGLEDDGPFPLDKDKDNDFSGSNFFKDSGEREPFLSDTDSSERLSSVWSSGAGVGTGRVFTTSSLRVSALDHFPPTGNKARTN